MTQYFIIPGLGNSGEGHWQTWMQHTGPNFKRIEQQEWDKPDCGDWIRNINEALAGYDLAEVVLIGHSLACATIAHWAAQSAVPVKGALLVAPSDLDTPQYAAFQTTGFTPMPTARLPFKTIVVTSTNDHWVTTARAQEFAHNWGSELISIGDAGHINGDSGFGEWPRGLEILKQLG